MKNSDFTTKPVRAHIKIKNNLKHHWFDSTEVDCPKTILTV